MAQLIITYWRDIPAQVTVKKGRKSARRELTPRFSEAIDMCAMRSGLTGTDAYLDEWRRGEPAEVSDDLEAEAERAATRLESEFTRDRLVALVGNEGRNSD